VYSCDEYTASGTSEMAGCRNFSYTSGTSHMSTSLPPVTGHVGGADYHARQHISQLPERSHYSDYQFGLRLTGCREMSLPELTEQTRMTTSRHPPPARTAAATQQVQDSWIKHWSSELPAYSRRSLKQSTVSTPEMCSALSMWSENGSCQSKSSYQQPNSNTALRRSSSMRGPLIDTSVTPAIARKASISMDNLTDKHSAVIIILVCTLHRFILCIVYQALH